MKKNLIYTILLWLLASAVTAEAAPKLGDVGDGSRADFVHLIPLINSEGAKITPGDELLLPFTNTQTCGECHSYGPISSGWHFNAADPNVDPGRVGQPWILADAGSATQIPLSYRSWPGAFDPAELGITTWQFTKMFGRQMPGGGVGEADSDDPDEMMRQFVSGKLEVNCLACHNANPGQDQAEYAMQVAKQNFLWAAAGSCEFASVAGAAKDMPETYDPMMPGMLEDPKLIEPSVTYRPGTFDHKNRVMIDVVTDISSSRCYFCHSNKDIVEGKDEKWMTDQDVHLAAGLKCVDCHRNGLEHNINRGYEGEDDSHNPMVEVSTCRGCHIPEKDAQVPVSGRFAAPEPEHKGLPPVHFDKLNCTACHSGLWPQDKTMRTKTSRAHALGVKGASKSFDILPHLVTPVFAKQSNGKMGPHKLLWPAYWAIENADDISPIDLKSVKSVTAEVIARDRNVLMGNWPDLSEEDIAKILSLFNSQVVTEGSAVYVSGGKLYRVDDKGKLSSVEHEVAKPYMWPIAHNVRPAAQSLGVRECQDCHSTDEGFFFSDVEVDTPIVSQRGEVVKMVEFEELDPGYTKNFAMSFVFRPWLKVAALAVTLFIAAVLLLYGLKALGCVLKWLSGHNQDN